MNTERLPPSWRGLRLRVTVDDYDGHPKVPPGTVVNVIGNPRHPEFLVIRLDSPIEIRSSTGDGTISTQLIAVSGYWFELGEIINPPRQPSPWFVKVWHVYDPGLATANEIGEGMAEYVSKGGLTRFIPSDLKGTTRQ